MPKRKCNFSDSLKTDFPFIRESEINDKVECTICKSTFSIKHGGRSDIKDHMEKKKHKDALSAASSSKKLSTLFTKKMAGLPELKLAAEEGTFTYLTVVHNHSFRSMDCTSSLVRKLFERPKYNCARTKCEAIVVNVLAPYTLSVITEELKNARYL